MARYGGDSYGRYPGRGAMGPGPRVGGYRRGGPYDTGYDGGYSGGWNGQRYGIYFDGGPRGGGEPRGGWGYGGRRPEERGGPRGREPQRARQSAGDSICVAEVMTRNPEAVTADTPLMEVARRMRELDVGIIPVVEAENDLRLRGVITDRDIAVRAAAEGEDMKKARVGDFMSRDIQTVRENDHVREVFDVMKRQRVRRVPVLDEQGALVGIVAQADLAVTYAGLDLERESEVEEVIERISEPARPRWGKGDGGAPSRRMRVGGSHRGYDRDLGDRLREGWQMLRREARQVMGRGYDRDRR